MNFSYPQIALSEVPDEISLTLSISGCPFRCKGCHSKETWDKNWGELLTIDKLNELINKNKHITCVLFYGGEWRKEELKNFIKFVKNKGLKTALYSGMNSMIEDLEDLLDYYKIGEYIEELGGLQSEKTNQQIYKKDVCGIWQEININNMAFF
jgi:anaerobic ribonucleoside-triphosphate reductase activating protein